MEATYMTINRSINKDVLNIHAYTHTHTHTYVKGCTYHQKKNEKLPCATTWIDSEDIMLTETSQKEKDKFGCYHIY